jgi:peptidoglycan-N-acetylglucosamine deacetylase
MTSERSRADCLHRANVRFVLTLMPAMLCIVLASFGQWPWAALVFCAALATITIGTLVPRCSLFGPLVKRQPPGSKSPLLTIDDGPHPEHTPAVLDILDRHGLKAIFFLIGDRAEQYPHLVHEIIRRGHEIANHTQTHPAASFWTLTPARMWDEIARCQETLTRIAPEHPPRWFRPPAGHHNAFCVLTARAIGLETLMWTARGFDGTLTNTDSIVSRIRRKLTPDGIVLIHEGTPVCLEVTEKVAEMLAGYTAERSATIR